MKRTQSGLPARRIRSAGARTVKPARTPKSRSAKAKKPAARTVPPKARVSKAVPPKTARAKASKVRAKPAKAGRAKPVARRSRTKRVSPLRQSAAALRRPKAPIESKPEVSEEVYTAPAGSPTAESASPLESEEEEPVAVTEPIAIPAILLEGDQPLMPVGGPGEKFVLGPQSPEPVPLGGRDLPEAYGTGRLLLVARDPHWLYAHWDLTRDQQRAYNRASVDRHMVVRVRTDMPGSQPKEVHVHPESRHWFIEVEQAGTSYVAELGYYGESRDWTSVIISKPVATPPAGRASDKSAEFVRVHTSPLPTNVEPVFEGTVLPEATSSRVPDETVTSVEGAALPAPLLAPPRIGWIPALERPTVPARAAVWTEAQEQALAELVHFQSFSSAELGGNVSVGESPGQPEFQQVSSLMGGLPKPAAGFWFKINAELIVYGATEPNASVTLGGEPISLRPDGTFSVRLALPDGSFALPVAAKSVAGELRQAQLQFSRRTERQGEVEELNDPANPPCE